MTERPHFPSPQRNQQEQIGISGNANKLQGVDTFSNSTEIVHAFIDHQITIEQLNEALRRDSERIINTVDIQYVQFDSNPAIPAEYSRYDSHEEQISEQEINDKIVQDHVLGVSGSRGSFYDLITSAFQRACGVIPKNQRK